jgi:hypothetical protein
MIYYAWFACMDYTISKERVTMQQQTEHSNDFYIAFSIGVREAREQQQPELTGDGLLLLAVKAYHKASKTLSLNLDEFLQGWASGWGAYYAGIVDEKGATD